MITLIIIFVNRSFKRILHADSPEFPMTTSWIVASRRWCCWASWVWMLRYSICFLLHIISIFPRLLPTRFFSIPSFEHERQQNNDYNNTFLCWDYTLPDCSNIVRIFICKYLITKLSMMNNSTYWYSLDAVCSVPRLVVEASNAQAPHWICRSFPFEV